MEIPSPQQRNFNYAVGMALLVLSAFVIPLFGRSLDDNRLTSWEWVFQNAHAPSVFLLLIAGIVCSYGMARLPRPPVSASIMVGTITFFAAIPFWREPEVIVDAARYFTQAKYLELHGAGFFLREWGRQIHAWTDMPLVPFLYGTAFSLFGESRIVIQVLTTTLFSLTAVLTCKTGTLLWDEETGLYGGMLLLGIPYLYTQVPLMLADVPAMFFFMLAVFIFLTALRRGGVWIVLSPVAIVSALLAKYSAALMFSVLPVICYVVLSGKEKEEFRAIGFRIVAIAVLTLIFSGIIAITCREVFTEQVRLLLSFQAPGLRRWGESYLSTFFFQTHPVLSAAALASCYFAFRKRDRKFLIIAWLIVLVLVLQIRRIRYVILVFPMLALMASYGIRELRDRFLKQFLVSSLVCSSLVIALFGYLPFLQTVSTVNLQHAGQYLDTLKEEKVDVYPLLPEHPAGNLVIGAPLLDLFTTKQIALRGPETFPLSDETGRSSLRFTWEYAVPSYYPEPGKKADVIVVISDNQKQGLPADLGMRLQGFRLLKSFNTDDGVFRFRTMVRVYGKEGTSQ